MKENFINDIRIITIENNGDINAIFSANDCSSKNTIHLSESDNMEKIMQYYETIKDEVYKSDKFKDRHLFYIKDFLIKNNITRLNNTDVDKINDDLLMYYFLAEMGNIIVIKSFEHINILIIPRGGITEMQKNKISSLISIFPKDMIFEIVDNMHLEVFNDNDGNKYATLEVGDTTTYNLEEISQNIIVQKNSKIRVFLYFLIISLLLYKNHYVL